MKPDLLCIGSVLWDIIGRSNAHMSAGSDVPGRITRIPGGVALNVAMAARAYGMTPALLSVVGRDPEGDELVAAVGRLGIVTDLLHRSDDLPTDRYMAVEGGNGLIAAIADAHSLEAAGDKILTPLDGLDWRGPIVLDGNLTLDLLAVIATDPRFASADLRVAPASPGKAERLQPFLEHRAATLYVNLEEAGILLHGSQTDAGEAAEALLARGLHRVIVTDGPRLAACADPNGCIRRTPPEVMVTRVTGAGDTFMAAHIAAELQGADSEDALRRACDAAATYVSSDTY
ncbi:PfkB family carbohydrate kinase [Jannaschia aquimarina]|uniref:PsuK protein n=1 Tax=Jannaschia aquimarina TaxID=935700 RepID=A0A0D1D8A4_9RHOB|nr:PfkB family carbohydrate kinase [Jannaschia aquimarina]KIT16158.1 Pseudouridine kinase [Jannaschia aquimarina]SNT36983.1 Sugar or nucleoside kinase, ribokinase family [Jannaschia aquimarina]